MMEWNVLSSCILFALLFSARATPLGTTRHLSTRASFSSTLTRVSIPMVDGRKRRRKVTSGETDLIPTRLIGNSFLTDIAIGDQSFNVILDTGSSDTWVAGTGYQCISRSSDAQVSQSTCNLNPTYSADETFTLIPNENMLSGYADGTFIQGPVGYSAVTLAGLTVPRQIVGVAEQADGTYSGLVGLAFPALTRVYDVPESSSNLDSPGNYVETSSLMYTMFNATTFQPPLAPFFSLAISRDRSASGYAGVFTIGSNPDFSDPRVNCSSSFVAAPWEIYPSHSTTQYSSYAISIDGFNVNGVFMPQSEQFIVDSGTTLLKVPKALADAFNAQWSPAGFNNKFGAFQVSCNAVPPTFTIVIGGFAININPLDLIYDTGLGYCTSSVSDNGNSDNYLGDVFHRNVLAVYDWGNYQMKFFPREYYES